MKKLAKIFLFVGTLSFAALFISSPLLHNHEIDFNNHNNCPAFILNITFASLAFVFFAKVFINFPKPEYKTFSGKVTYISCKLIQTQSNRAPPF